MRLAWLLLGGALAPIGSTVSFVDRPARVVLSAIEAIRARRPIEMEPAGRLPESARVLDPMEAPWTVELVIDCGEWTAYLNNFIGGGDLTAVAPAVAQRLGADCVGVEHTGLYGPGHAGTQFWLQGPGGAPPLNYIRTLSAIRQDGSWSWHTSGTLQAFERPERYERSRISERLDRATLVEYLHALDIRVDDPSFFGEGTVVRQGVDGVVRRQTADQWRAENLS